MKADHKNTRFLQRVIVLIILALALVLILKYGGTSRQYFYWTLCTFMVINFWKYQKKEEMKYFFVPFGLGVVMMFPFIGTIIGWISRVPMFSGFWADIFGWPALISVFALVFYSLLLLDKGPRTDVKHRVNIFFGL